MGSIFLTMSGNLNYFIRKRWWCPKIIFEKLILNLKKIKIEYFILILYKKFIIIFKTGNYESLCVPPLVCLCPMAFSVSWPRKSPSLACWIPLNHLKSAWNWLVKKKNATFSIWAVAPITFHCYDIVYKKYRPATPRREFMMHFMPFAEYTGMFHFL